MHRTRIGVAIAIARRLAGSVVMMILQGCGGGSDSVAVTDAGPSQAKGPANITAAQTDLSVTRK